MADKPAKPPDALTPSTSVPPGAFVFSPRTVATVSVLVAVACLGTLVVVATQKNVDALSTIALALAILAFAAQLIIYIAQAATSNQQLFLAQQVQRETAALLSGIQATVESKQANLVQQYERVIDRLIATTAEAKAPPGGDDEGADENGREALEHRLRGIVREEVARSQPTLMSPLAKIDPNYQWPTPGSIRAVPWEQTFSFYPSTSVDPSKLREDPSKLNEEEDKAT